MFRSLLAPRRWRVGISATAAAAGTLLLASSNAIEPRRVFAQSAAAASTATAVAAVPSPAAAATVPPSAAQRANEWTQAAAAASAAALSAPPAAFPASASCCGGGVAMLNASEAPASADPLPHPEEYTMSDKQRERCEQWKYKAIHQSESRNRARADRQAGAAASGTLAHLHALSAPPLAASGRKVNYMMRAMSRAGCSTSNCVAHTPLLLLVLPSDLPLILALVSCASLFISPAIDPQQFIQCIACAPQASGAVMHKENGDMEVRQQRRLRAPVPGLLLCYFIILTAPSALLFPSPFFSSTCAATIVCAISITSRLC